MNRNEKLVEILENEQFRLELQNVQTAEELQELLATYGAEMSLDEVKQFCEQVVAQVSSNGELNEMELKNVAGGGGVGVIVACVIIGGVLRTIKNGAKVARVVGRIQGNRSKSKKR